ncbi:DUF3185 family protein [Marinospirillum alkaliphilum]|uniref:DUF3185 family protein n=1 Tax=Marinospirillum alkaliphilum DSM 21637 TaxID=1122209 RepID=A0A1K1XDV7_9GAMM|nr:DUF3185 family protein [Marinospirillum alkaliphilum]SFX47792.1 Protein of unknown function [Marinospirillum alkaliphilum DSM 21637]
MSLHHIIGILLLIAGGALLYFGYQASRRVGEQIYQSFAGRFTDSTTWYLIGGVTALISGLVLLISR